MRQNSFRDIPRSVNQIRAGIFWPRGEKLSVSPARSYTVLTKIEACVPALRRHATAILGGRQPADALVGASLIQAIEQLDTVCDDTNIRTWLFSIMYSLLPGKRRLTTPAGQSESLGTSHGTRTEITESQSDDRRRWLSEELDSLDQKQREVIAIILVEDFTYEQAARVLGLSVEAVLTLLAAARDRLLVRSGTGPMGFATLQDVSPWPAIAEENFHAYVDELLDPEHEAAVKQYFSRHPEAAELAAAYARQRQEIRAAFCSGNPLYQNLSERTKERVDDANRWRTALNRCFGFLVFLRPLVSRRHSVLKSSPQNVSGKR